MWIKNQDKKFNKQRIITYTHKLKSLNMSINCSNGSKTVVISKEKAPLYWRDFKTESIRTIKEYFAKLC